MRSSSWNLSYHTCHVNYLIKIMVKFGFSSTLKHINPQKLLIGPLTNSKVTQWINAYDTMNRYYGEVAKPKNPAALSILAYRIGSRPATSINSTVSEQHSPPNGDKRPDLKRNEYTNRPTTTTAAARKSTKNKQKSWNSA